MTDPDDLVARLRACETEYVESQPVGLGPPYNPDGPEAAAEIESLRDLLGRLCVYFCECEGTDYIEADGRPSYPRSDAITDAEAKEIARYREAARAKMEGEG